MTELEDFTAKIDTNHSEGRIEGLIPYYDIIFNLDCVNNTIDSHILISLSILLPVPISKLYMSYSFNSDQDKSKKREFKDSVIKLEAMGFISEDELTIYMHEIIQYYVRYKLKPTSEKCNDLICLFNEEMRYNTFNMPIQNFDILPHVENIVRLFKAGSSKLLAAVQLNIIHAFQAMSLYPKSFEYLRILETDYQETIASDNLLKIDYHLLYSATYKHDQENYSFKKAIKHLRKYRELSFKLYGKDSNQIATCFGEMGFHFFKNKDYKNSKKFFHKAYEIHMNLYGEKHKDIGLYYNNIGDIYNALKEYSSAIQSYCKAIEIYKSLPIPHDSSIRKLLAHSYSNQARSYINRDQDGDIIKAESNLNIALEICTALFGNIHAIIVDIKLIQIDIAEKRRDFIEKILLIEDCIKILTMLYGSKHSRILYLEKLMKQCHINPSTLEQFLNRDINAIENLEWHYAHIGCIHLARFYSLNSLENFDITLDIVAENKISQNQFVEMSKESLRNARIAFKKSGNQNMINSTDLLIKNNNWLRLD